MTHPSDAQLTAQVLLLTEGVPEDKDTLSYAVPHPMATQVDTGSLVTIPLNRRLVQGVVLHVAQQQHQRSTSVGYTLRSIEGLISPAPLMSAQDLDYYRWIAEQTATPLPQVIEAAVPAGILQTPQQRLVLCRPVSALEKLKWRPLAVSALALLEKSPDNTLSLKFVAQQLEVALPQLRQALKPLIALGHLEVQTTEARPATSKTAAWVQISKPHSALTAKQQQICDALSRWPDGTWANDLCAQVPTTMATLKRLAATGSLTLDLRPVPAKLGLGLNRTELASAENAQAKPLNPAQQDAVTTLLDQPTGHRWWLHGVTGSGKTEVYRALAQAVLAQQQGVMILLPEIALTGQIGRRLIAALHPHAIALWHSKLRPGERAQLWRQIQAGQIRVVIGARSAMLMPMPNVGLIVIDEAHDGSYKQDAPAPRYDARHLAKYRAHQLGARLVFGSATPDVADFYDAKRTGHVITLPQRFGERELPPVTIVDMRSEGKAFSTSYAITPKPASGSLLSCTLQDALRATLEAQQQAIVLINRRGFYTTVRCRTCDHRFLCPDCDVTMTAHRGHDHLLCHYCGHQTPYPQFCTACASNDIEMLGTGTQRVEQALAQVFPDARVLRLDTDVAQKRGGTDSVLSAFAAGEADILVGTQMVAKGLDLPNVTLVGVLAADGSFQLPDYKATERGFQLLTQVAGRAGRGQSAGRVVFQTYQPTHPVIQLAQAQDYNGFYDHEITQRQLHGFPPFRTMVRLMVSHPNQAVAQAFIQSLATQLKAGQADGFDILGPAPCVIPRIQNRFRMHLLVQCPIASEDRHDTDTIDPHLRRLLRWYRQTHQHLPPDLRYFIDIDPQTLL
jgi:primosomal protein N' (replication factor Y)